LDCVQISALVKIEDLVARTLVLLALEEGQKVVAVEVLFPTSSPQITTMFGRSCAVAGATKAARPKATVAPIRARNLNMQLLLPSDSLR
jgi:hypothetical protein